MYWAKDICWGLFRDPWAEEICWGLFRDPWAEGICWGLSRDPITVVWAILWFSHQQKTEQEKKKNVSEMGLLAAIGVLLPFPFYWWLWTNPQSWVNLCGRGRDPSTVMARVSHVLKAAQLLSLFSVASLSWPPLYFWPLMAFGQFLNFRSSSSLNLLNWDRWK